MRIAMRGVPVRLGNPVGEHLEARMETKLPTKLHPNRLKWLGFLVISLVFVACGIWMIPTDAYGWAVAGFFGLGVLVCALQFIPNSSYLVLNASGLILRTMYREQKFRWTDINEFGVAQIGRREMVVWNYSIAYNAKSKSPVQSQGPSGFRKRMASFNKNWIGWEAGLPDTYGQKAADFAELLNKVRQQYSRIEQATSG